MRFLHIADLHLGKTLNDFSLREDQEEALRQIAEIAEREEVDAVLVAGDVYQKSSPQSEAMAQFDAFVTKLIRGGRRVFVVSGNHDSSQRISYFSSLIRGAGVYVSERFEGQLQTVTLEDEFGPLDLHLLPFVRPAQVRRLFPEEKIETSQQAVEAVLRHSNVDFTRRNVLVCHQFITGAETSDSEEQYLGTLDNIEYTVFDGFDYVALGHIHRPQRVGRDTLRYAGSPLKYSFSEVSQKKSVTVVDLGPKGEIAVRTVPIRPLRDLNLVDGMLDEIMSMPYSEDYVWVTAHDELVPPDARISVSTVFPNLMKFTVSNSKTRQDADVQARERLQNRTVSELFEDFYRLLNGDQEPGPLHRKVMEDTVRELEEEKHE